MKEMVGGCCVCSDECGWTENPLVYCDGQGCNVAVHQACYGIITVPSGPWFCKKCESQERAARVGQIKTKKCELCPQKDGALKRTDNGWCHVVCALFIPEAWFGNVQTMEPIILKGVPPERFNKTCFICEEQGRASKSATGACMQCNKNGCKTHFHVTCAQSMGLLCEEQSQYDNVKYCGYCIHHFKKLQKKDSHIKTIPAFKPIPNENATPENTPEKLAASQKDKRPISTSSGRFIHSKVLKEKKMAAVAAQAAAEKKSAGKFTTANFTETTITPSPNVLDFGESSKKADSEDTEETSSKTEESSTDEEPPPKRETPIGKGKSKFFSDKPPEKESGTATSTSEDVYEFTDVVSTSPLGDLKSKGSLKSEDPKPDKLSYNSSFESFSGKGFGSNSKERQGEEEGSGTECSSPAPSDVTPTFTATKTRKRNKPSGEKTKKKKVPTATLR